MDGVPLGWSVVGQLEGDLEGASDVGDIDGEVLGSSVVGQRVGT